MRCCAVIFVCLAMIPGCAPTDVSGQSDYAGIRMDLQVEFSVHRNRVIRSLSSLGIISTDTLTCGSSNFTADSLEQITRGYLELLQSKSPGAELYHAGTALSACLLNPVLPYQNPNSGTDSDIILQISLKGPGFLKEVPFSSLPVHTPQPGYLSEFFIVRNLRNVSGNTKPVNLRYNDPFIIFRPEYFLYNNDSSTDFPAIKTEYRFSMPASNQLNKSEPKDSGTVQPYNIHHFSGHTRLPDSMLIQQTAGADLLILNTCNSLEGAGKWQYGRNLTVPVLGTLSPIEDDFSAQFITEFYRSLNSYLLHNNSSTNPAAEALRDTRFRFMENPYYSHPYYWGAYELIEF